MLLFVGDTVISERRLINVVFLENVIKVNYDGGEMLEVAGQMYPRIETLRLVLENAEEVNKVKRQFYKACKEGLNVFYFG